MSQPVRASDLAPPRRDHRAASGAKSFDVDAVRRDFPILSRRIHGKPLVYLDSAATAQKPQVVIDALSRFYSERCSNVHRGVYLLSEEATAAYEEARRVAQRFLRAGAPEEIVFTRGTTEAVNLVAQTFGRQRVGAGDAVLITAMEHHSNLVPWQLLCEQVGARLVVAPMDDRGQVILEEWRRLLGEGVKLAAFVHVSNALGTVNPAREMVALAHERGVPVLVDGAQAAPHMPVDVAELGCDFFAFSGHKVYGPMGIGVLYGRRDHLEAMPPYHGGGEMIRSVTFERTTYAEPPAKFEAGTPNVAGAVGLAAALEYVEGLGREAITGHEAELLAHALEAVSQVPGLRLIGTAAERASVLSFVLDGVHPHDVGTILDHEGIAIRAGHHCAQPVMDRFGVPATARASFALYNTHDEVDRLVAGLKRVQELFA